MSTTTKKKSSVVDGAKRFGDDLIDTGRKIWLAGIGAVSMVDEEARETFDKLVDRGEKYDRIDTGVVARAKRIGRDVEDRVQSTVESTLNRAGVPSRNEIHDLIHRVEELTAKVDAMAAKR